MNVNKETVQVLLGFQGLTVPPEDLDSITTRLKTWLRAMDEIEAEMGPLLDHEDPIPPVFPREEY